MRLADSGRRTHAMKREGMRGGSSSEGVEVPDSLGPEGGGARALRSDTEDRIPERIPIPRVPGFVLCQFSGQESTVVLYIPQPRTVSVSPELPLCSEPFICAILCAIVDCCLLTAALNRDSKYKFGQTRDGSALARVHARVGLRALRSTLVIP